MPCPQGLSVVDHHLLLLCSALGVGPARALPHLTETETKPWALSRAVASLLQGDTSIPGVGPVRLQRFSAALQLADCLAREALNGTESFSSPEQSAHWLRLHLGLAGREVFCCLFLDARHRLIAAEDLFAGTVDGASVYPRVVVERALRLGAAAIIAAHNHPSGHLEPSQADIRITERLRAALALVDIRLLDHLVVGGGRHVSLAELGYC